MNLLSFVRAKHNLVFKLLVVAVCSFFMALMLPNREIKGHKVNDFNAIWAYPDVIAEQDFLIEKTESEMRLEKEDIEKNAPLFFVQRNSERNEKLLKLENLKHQNEKAYNALKPLFDSIYKRGVIETVSVEEAQKPMFVSNGKYEEASTYHDFFTVKTASDFLEQRLASQFANVNYTDYLAINFFLSKEKTDLYLNAKNQHLALFKQAVQQGEIIVKQGEPLTDEKRFLINRYYHYQNQNVDFSFARFFAKWILSFILCITLMCFLAFFRSQIFGQNKQVAFLFLLMLLSLFFVYVLNQYGFNIYVLPFALVPIVVRVFFDSRTALFTFLMLVLHCSLFAPDKLEFILLQLIPGIGTLFVIAEMRKRQQILDAALIVFLFYALVFAAYQSSFGTPKAITKLTAYIPFAISSTLVLLAYPLIYIIEKFFGFMSDFKLLELSDLNQPLLRKLAKEVPGTFQHSLQVANLAEEAVFYIGGNSLLVRAGAMYHDIGKMKTPNFFSENQANGFSPHQEMEALESARVIINHVIEGIELAKKHHLPEQIIDFIRTHHGTTTVGYFYKLYQQQHPDTKIDENLFRYQGPIPFSKETAVLMIADSVEAASRSKKNLDALAIDNLVDNMVDTKIANNQFINSDITFKDITAIKKIFKKRLMTIYHARIEYPV
ncbi:MAG: HDIG domain-containing protein [Bacteroidetes bacterium]|nr:HDIG domain-containing protein [Bacteroidota bacterium]